MCYSVSILKKGIDFNKLNVPSWDKGVKMLTRVDAVRYHDHIGHNSKTMKNICNHKLTLIKEMLSYKIDTDNDEFDKRILNHLSVIESMLKQQVKFNDMFLYKE